MRQINQNNEQSKIRYIDLFAGAGGLSSGLSMTGMYNRLFAIEKDPDAFTTYKNNLINHSFSNWPDWLEMKNWDIIDLMETHSEHLRELSGDVDLIVGGPPCQGFSLAGKRSHTDERNLLPTYYLRAIEAMKPKAIFFENVKGFNLPFKASDGGEKTFSKDLMIALEELGYTPFSRIIDFSEHGVPQRRERFILFATRKDIGINPVSFFNKLNEATEPFLKKRNLKYPITVRDAIGDLLQSDQEKDGSSRFLFGTYTSDPKSAYQDLMRSGNEVVLNHRFPNHKEEIKLRFSEIIRKQLSNKDIRERYATKKTMTQLLDGEKPSPTLTTLPDDYIHYSEPRVLTPREYARIQSFPDSFVFYGKYTTGGKRRKLEVPIYSQIGNAIPPLFAELSGTVIGGLLNGI